MISEKKFNSNEDIGLNSEKVSSDIDKFIVSGQYLRQNFERDWYRNVLFYIGQQWITYSRTRRRWEKARTESWFPTPITNRFASTVDSMASVLAQKKPSVTAFPATDDEKDIATSEVANRILEVIDEEINEKEIRKELAKWVILCGHAFVLTYYDTSPENGEIIIPNKICPTCQVSFKASELIKGACPQCDNIDLQIDENNVETMPKGKIVSEVCSPFEIYIDFQIRTLENCKQFLRIRTRSLDWAKSRYPEFADELKNENAHAETTGQYYLTSLAYATNNNLGQYDSFFGGSYQRGDNIERVPVYEYFRMPDQDYPQGVYATRVGKTIVEMTKYPFFDSNDNPVIPLKEVKFFQVPGRLFGKTSADDLIHKQIQRNKIESLIQLALTRIANPLWLLPENISVSKLTGEPGQIIRYNALNPSGAKPERIPGQEVPASLFRWLEKLDQDFEELSGAYQAFKGAEVKGVPTYSGLNLLTERAISRFSELLTHWENFYKEWSQQKIELFRQYATEPRIKTIKGENGEWEANEFTKNSLEGNVNISIEAGSSVPKSKDSERVLILDLIKQGVIDLNDQKTRYQILEKFGLENLKEQYDIDVKDAIKELSDFKKTGKTRFRPMIDNHLIHLQEHIKFSKTDEFFDLPLEVQANWINHIVNEHQAFLTQGNITGGTNTLSPMGTQSIPELAGGKETIIPNRPERARPIPPMGMSVL